jgi:hypothetical protein
MAMALGAAREGLRVASQRAGESQAAESMPDHLGLYVDGNTFLEKPPIKSKKTGSGVIYGYEDERRMSFSVL